MLTRTLEAVAVTRLSIRALLFEIDDLLQQNFYGHINISVGLRQCTNIRFPVDEAHVSELIQLGAEASFRRLR